MDKNDSIVLFAPNAHSNFEIRWKAVSAEQRKVISDLLEAHYGIKNLEEIMQIDAFEVQSNNFRITYGGDNGLSRVLLRKHIKRGTPESLNAVDAILLSIAGGGVPVPEVISAKNGATYIEEEGKLWQLYGFITGDYYRGTERELVQAAAAVGRLHQALASLPTDKETNSPSWVMPTLRDFEFIFAGAVSDRKTLGALVREQQRSLTARIEGLSLHAAAIAGSSVQMIHADLHPHNFLFDDGKLTAILDFHEVRLGFRAADAASACHRLVRQYVVYPGKPWQEVLENGLQIFLTEYQNIFPLPQAELQLFPQFMELALLRKVKGNLLKYYEKKPEWPHEVAHKEFIKQLNLLAEIDVMKEPLREIIAKIA